MYCNYHKRRKYTITGIHNDKFCSYDREYCSHISCGNITIKKSFDDKIEITIGMIKLVFEVEIIAVLNGKDKEWSLWKLNNIKYDYKFRSTQTKKDLEVILNENIQDLFIQGKIHECNNLPLQLTLNELNRFLPKIRNYCEFQNGTLILKNKNGKQHRMTLFYDDVMVTFKRNEEEVWIYFDRLLEIRMIVDNKNVILIHIGDLVLCKSYRATWVMHDSTDLLVDYDCLNEEQNKNQLQTILNEYRRDNPNTKGFRVFVKNG
jgi:hypothetical protein